MEHLDALLDLPEGSVWRRADLHVHSPASPDIAPRWAGSKPDDLIREALNADLDVIAITDHNTAAWCDAARVAAENTDLTVFPGVELSTSEGHLLAIFNVDKPQQEIEDFLVGVGIARKHFGNTEVNARGGLDVVAQAIEKEGGVAIAAHVDREKGFWELLKTSRTRRKDVHGCQEIRAYEIVDARLKDQFRDGRSGYERRIAVVQGSDCFPPGGDRHHLDSIGHRHCYISMDEPSIVGLRLAFLDPDVRVRLMGEDHSGPETAIEGLWVAGGFLANQGFRFNDNITCLIGDTGSGKSLTIELLRYALDQQVDPKVLPRIAREVADLLGDNLEAMSAIHVIIRKGEDRYLLERAWMPDKEPPPPTVSRLVAGRPEVLTEEIHVPTFFPVKGFSQTEIIEYAREQTARLSLIDDLIDLSTQLSEIGELKGRLRQNATEMVAQYDLLEKSEKSLKDLPGLQEEIAGIDKFLTNKTVREHGLWAAERDVLDLAKETLDRLNDDIITSFPSLDSTLVHEDDLPDETPSRALRKALSDLDSEIQQTLVDSQGVLSGAIGALHQKLGGIRKRWSARYQKADEEYRTLLVDLDTAGRTQANLQERRTRLGAKVVRLKKLQRRITEEIRPRIEQLESTRDGLLTKLQGARRAIREKREAKAQELTRALDETVVIRVKPEADGREFKRQLLELRQGSFVHEADLEIMADKLLPIPLVKSLLADDLQSPAKESGLAVEPFRKYIDNVRDRRLVAELLELQLVDLPDAVHVQFAIGGAYRDLEKIAHGQKCTVVLMIALAEGDTPLLVDQPEDALPAPWIEGYIATTLRTRRGSRQCIFATRSANVLVSADAEQIIAMKADADSGTIDRTGALDRFGTRDLVLYHVEGGELPFERRREKYGLSRHGA